MVKEKEAVVANILKTIDAIVIIISYILSYFIDDLFRTVYNLRGMAYALTPTLNGMLYFSKNNLRLTITFIPIWMFLLSFFRAYNDFRTRLFKKEIAIIVKAGLLSIVLFGCIFFITKMKLTSRLYIAIFIVTTIVCLILEKRLITFILDRIHEYGFNQINLLVVGTGKRAQKFIKVLKEHKNWGLNIVGLIDDEHGMYGKNIEGYRILGRIQDIPFILHRIVIDRVIFVIPRLWLNRIDYVILAWEREGIATSISMDLYDLRIAEIRQTNFSGFPLLEFETFTAKEWQLFLKGILEILL